jgi:hypothetical protein
MATKSRPGVEVDDEVGRMANVYLRLFSTPDGQIVLEDFRKSFGDRRSFVENDALTTAFKEGERNVYLAVLDLLARARDPSRYRVTVETE